MKSTASKKKASIPIKKYGALFGILFFIVILFFLEHFNEPSLTLEDLKPGEAFDQVKPEVGYIAPPFTVRNLKGNLDSLANYKGQVVVLNFWATWCGPCRVEMPSFETLYRRYRSQGMTVLAVSLDKGADDKVKKFVEEHDLSFPVLMDSDGQAERLYPSVTIPFTYVIGRSGRVVARVDGAKDWQSDETFEAIEFLLKKS
jgi:peroxiredoxin